MTLQDLQKRQTSQTSKHEYEVEVEDILHQALEHFNDRDIDAIHQHLNSIEQALSKELEGSIDLIFGGSVSKHTYVNGLSDVDMLVCLNDRSLEGKRPAEVLAYFEQMIKNRLPQTSVKVGDLAVTVTFSDGHQIQLLPATRAGTGYKIAEPAGGQWSNIISPEKFASKLTQVNRTQEGKVIPTIKLIKSLNEELPKQSRLSGYHIESLAIEIFKNYSGSNNLKSMVQHFMQCAQGEILHPIADKTGQSRHVDDYLGSTGSDERQKASKAIGSIAKRLDQADNTNSSDVWEEMINL
jgi:hypothetical protein